MDDLIRRVTSPGAIAIMGIHVAGIVVGTIVLVVSLVLLAGCVLLAYASTALTLAGAAGP